MKQSSVIMAAVKSISLKVLVPICLNLLSFSSHLLDADQKVKECTEALVLCKKCYFQLIYIWVGSLSATKVFLFKGLS